MELVDKHFREKRLEWRKLQDNLPEEGELGDMKRQLASIKIKMEEHQKEIRELETFKNDCL
jgi:hypothetical protein